MDGKLIAAVYVFLCVLQWSIGQLASYTLDEAPSSVAVNSENGEVFIATSSQLLRLSRGLDLLETANVSGELVRMALSPDGSRLVGCLGGDSRTCLVFDTSDLSSGPTAVENAHYNPQNGLAIVTTEESFYLGSEGEVDPAGSNDNIYLAQYNYTSELVRTTGTERYRVLADNFVRHFYGGVARNGYVYFFVADVTPNAIRTLRVCDCSREPCTSEFEALYEQTVECSTSPTENNRVCGADLVESFADQTEPLVVMTRCEDVEDGARNRVCALRLADIDGDMDAYFTGCQAQPPTFTDSELPWEDILTPCSQFSVSEME